MKKCTQLMVYLICLFQVLNVDAKVLRVGFFGPAVANVDYSNLQLALDAAVNGDTIYCFPGGATNGSYTISKRVVLIGYGNWLNPSTTPKGNANMQAFNGQSDLGTVYLHSGSSGTIITGFFGGYVYVGAANDVIIRRNRNTYVYLGSTQGVATTNNLQILENYRVWVQAYTNPGYNFTNLNISNNFMWGISLQNGNTYSGNIAGNIWAYSAVETEAESNSYPSGNELAGGSFLLQNNILASFTTSTPASNYNYFPWSGVGNCIFNYNVMIAGYNAATFPATGTGNVSIPSDQAASLFEGFPTSGSRSADDRWVLKSGSPALVAARPGSTVNAGIFGGPNPYKLSTIPAIPTIYSLSSPDGNNPAGGTIQINVSTRGNN